MRLAILSESAADEAAIRVLVEGILGQATLPVELFQLPARGVDRIATALPSVVRHLYYRTEADALVVVVDSDLTPVHQPAHEEKAGIDAKCRLCQMRQAISQVQNDLRAKQLSRPLVKIALGLAVPTIDAWYLCGKNANVREMAWTGGLQAKQLCDLPAKLPYTKQQLKLEAYGTDRPSLQWETQIAIRESQRIVQNHLPVLEALFPNGFGGLAQEVRSWSL